MARKTFAYNREPHVADLGNGEELHFVPEVYGDKFLDAYAELQEAQKELGAEDGKTEGLSSEKFQKLYTAIRMFLMNLMTEECADRFSRFEVSVPGQDVKVFRVKADAEAYAAAAGAGAAVADRSMILPSRLLVEVMEWAIELYGGGQKRPTGPSKGSSGGSRRTGTSGRATSRSKA